MLQHDDRVSLIIIRNSSDLSLSIYHRINWLNLAIQVERKSRIDRVYKLFAQTDENSVGPCENSTALGVINYRFITRGINRATRWRQDTTINYSCSKAGKNSFGARENNTDDKITRATK